MQRTIDEKQLRARNELNRLYPGLTNKQVTDIQKQRLEWALAHPLGTDSHPSTASRINPCKNPEPHEMGSLPCCAGIFFKKEVVTEPEETA